MILTANPLVSIIVPVYNVERYLDECLDSIRGQTYERLEIIVVEDYSTDDSLVRLNAHFTDPRVRLIQHERNSGLSAARNTGIEAAKGEFVLFVDSDDAIAPELVETCLAQATETGADVVVFDFVAFQDGEALPKIGDDVGSAGSRKLFGTEYFKLPHFAWLKFIRTELLRDPRLRFPVGDYYEDWPFHWELGFSAAKIIILNGSWYHYRQRGTSITASMGRKLLDQFKVQQTVGETVRLRGTKVEASVLFAKAHGTFWSVLTRIDKNLLSEAVVSAKKLRSALRTLRPQYPRGSRAGTIGLLLSLPFPLASIGIRVLRVIKGLLSTGFGMRNQPGVRNKR
ncbi:glycosyltransferase family 2 protein [Halomonas sp. MC140]|nr:glycosyltransferase family 2 protein [Halomonas sp. MC140]MDN7131511.1 glycosyltransferase family 2 protein [Halomonas sp. MC140]